MILAINPTRMELLKLRRRIAIARRGHKLLRDKEDELMRRFLAIIEEAKALRDEVEKSLKEVFRDFLTARSMTEPKFMDTQLSAGKKTLEIKTERERFLNLKLARFEIAALPEYPRYSFFATTSDLDEALVNFRNLLGRMIKLAELELKIKLVSEEIKKTRRRVNALEYIFIPNLVDTVNYINMKLTELERGNITRLMRVKELIEAGK